MKLSALVMLPLLSGCISLVPATADSYRNTSSMELCRQYLTFPSMNIHQRGRAEALAQRGETCGTTPAGAAAMQQNADRQMMDTIQALQPPPVPTPTTQTYILNGKMVTCTTVGTITNCR